MDLEDLDDARGTGLEVEVWRTGGLKQDQEQRRPRRPTERINEAQQPLAKTRSDAAAVAEEKAAAADRAAAEEEAQEDAAAVAEVETLAAERTASTSEWAASFWLSCESLISSGDLSSGFVCANAASSLQRWSKAK
ncbi:Hypothetical predicted protein [Cloeon dipterum]|uniref:Uncharacterized protein n=1 Tax=Cloeon dipterum TaxID=197152 RepID=A0A8S1DU53_9INSE|nr:Hypothetical predicted protein [Cloeon dipterum]